MVALSPAASGEDRLKPAAMRGNADPPAALSAVRTSL